MVFPYMDHDLAGLLDAPNVVFSPAQIKCYMKQLLTGIFNLHRVRFIAPCNLKYGLNASKQAKVIHRDIKCMLDGWCCPKVKSNFIFYFI